MDQAVNWMKLTHISTLKTNFSNTKRLFSIFLDDASLYASQQGLPISDIAGIVPTMNAK